MIIDVPTSKDFEQSGIGFLNLAWSNALDLLINLDDWGFGEEGKHGAGREEYWQSGQRLLATAAALAQQGTELLLKARIAAVSPFLLLSGDPDKWPSGCNKKDIAFADFRTIDAQDLIRAHDTVCSVRLSERFKQSFESLRHLRNCIFHTVDHRIKVKVDDVVRTILSTSHNLVGPKQWLSKRRESLRSSPVGASDEGEFVMYGMVREIKKLVSTLATSELDEFLGIKRKARWYLCQSCNWACADCDIEANCAQLVPNTPTSTNLHCFACGKDTPVVRQNCGIDNCKSNVIAVFEGYCCLCNEEHGSMAGTKAD